MRRASERRRLTGPAQFRRGSTRERVELRDLSRSGARLTSMAPLREGLTIWIQIATLRPIEAVVVWSMGLDAGCAFAEALHPAVFDALTQSQVHPPGR